VYEKSMMAVVVNWSAALIIKLVDCSTDI